MSLIYDKCLKRKFKVEIHLCQIHSIMSCNLYIMFYTELSLYFWHGLKSEYQAMIFNINIGNNSHWYWQFQLNRQGRLSFPYISNPFRFLHTRFSPTWDRVWVSSGLYWNLSNPSLNDMWQILSQALHECAALPNSTQLGEAWHIERWAFGCGICSWEIWSWLCISVERFPRILRCLLQWLHWQLVPIKGAEAKSLLHQKWLL